MNAANPKVRPSPARVDVTPSDATAPPMPSTNAAQPISGLAQLFTTNSSSSRCVYMFLMRLGVEDAERPAARSLSVTGPVRRSPGTPLLATRRSMGLTPQLRWHAVALHCVSPVGGCDGLVGGLHRRDCHAPASTTMSRTTSNTTLTRSNMVAHLDRRQRCRRPVGSTNGGRWWVCCDIRTCWVLVIVVRSSSTELGERHRAEVAATARRDLAGARLDGKCQPVTVAAGRRYPLLGGETGCGRRRLRPYSP